MAMGSKRVKKSKELELLPEKNNINYDNDNSMLDPETSSDEDHNDVIQTDIAKALKRKKKHESVEVSKKVKKSRVDDFNKIKEQKTGSDDECQENDHSESENEGDDYQKDAHDSPVDKKKLITWPNEDLSELINRMETVIPEKDVLSYRCRLEKLNWENIAFKNYSAKECKETWLNVQKKIRRFRLLKEVLNDAKEWVISPANKDPKPKKHPDMPRRPLSSYLLFYLKKKDQIMSENPGRDMSDISKIIGQTYKNLPPEKRQKYDKLAASNREEYSEKLRIFFETHPELVPSQKLNHKSEKEKKVGTETSPKAEQLNKEKPIKSRKDRSKGERGKPGRPPKPDKPIIERPPKKCQTPFGLYYASELNNLPSGMEKNIFKEKCKAQYKQMSDSKKMYWINLAEQDLNRYQEEVKAYKAKYPDFQVNKVRPILTKREKLSKERASGKPVKPPNSAYALYSRVMLQSESIKSIHPKDRMNFIAGKWKNCTEEEQNVYKDQVITLLEQYKQDYETYVNSLPEEEKNLITQSKRKGQKVVKPAAAKLKSVRKPEKLPTEMKFKEPEQPPISPCKYFVTLYKGDGDPILAWKALNVEDKRKYEDELVKKKQAYIVEFERFLKSLTKEELEAFSRTRQQQTVSDDESSDCLSETEDEEDEGEVTNKNKSKIQNNDETHESGSE